ncbi:hypothetical protein ZWY2020_022017 [Hordeum vulgare]|nr:hypothetical protein ZWY2020_022017 [Hordeum vulgare]
MTRRKRKGPGASTGSGCGGGDDGVASLPPAPDTRGRSSLRVCRSGQLLGQQHVPAGPRRLPPPASRPTPGRVAKRRSFAESRCRRCPAPACPDSPTQPGFPLLQRHRHHHHLICVKAPVMCSQLNRASPGWLFRWLGADDMQCNATEYIRF